MVSTAAGFQADDTARQPCKELENLSAGQLSPNDLSILADPVDLEPALRDVEADYHRCHDYFLLPTSA